MFDSLAYMVNWQLFLTCICGLCLQPETPSQLVEDLNEVIEEDSRGSLPFRSYNAGKQDASANSVKGARQKEVQSNLL